MPPAATAAGNKDDSCLLDDGMTDSEAPTRTTRRSRLDSVSYRSIHVTAHLPSPQDNPLADICPSVRLRLGFGVRVTVKVTVYG